jgi:RNA polymerase sigma factor for flagellar operon FliA
VGLPRNVDQADLVSYGIFGLIEAIDRFEPERGFKFETYAITRIKGAMIDEMRSMDWVPRSVRAKAKAIEEAYSKFEATQHRSPTDEELAEATGMSASQLQTALSQISFLGVVALDDVVSEVGDKGGGRTLGDNLADPGEGPGALMELAEMRQLLARAIGGLPERERMTLSLYYQEGFTLAEIGRVFGVTESRACQIHTKAILHLRGLFAAADHEPA